MNPNHNMPVKSGVEKTDSQPTSFFPRVIREFDDGPDEKPMMYGGE